jgi:hypothetical protein
MTRKNFYAFALVAAVFVCLCSLPLTAQDDASATTVREAVGFAVSPPLRELAKLPRAPHYGLHEALPVRRIAKRNFGVAVDPVEQNTAKPSTNYSIGLNLLGVGNGFPGYTVPDAPPDTNLAVGDTQILQWVNVSFAVFNKFNGAIQAGPIEGNLLFSALGGPCANNNDGDIIAQWDNSAHQWLLAQNVFSGPPYYACVAISTSADALGTYYLYQFSLGNGFPDYPKWGRWNNNWAQTMNNFGPGGSGFVGAEVCVYNRTAILDGQSGPPAIQVCHQYSSNDDSLLPADIDSSNSPPAAEGQFFIGSVASVDNSHLSLYSVIINWLHPSLAVFTGNNNSQRVAVPTYTGPCSGSFGGDCVPQKGVTDELDSLGDRLMYRFAYDNDPVGGNQHWYVNHSVEATSGQIGLRWYEFQAPQIAIQPLALTLFQSGTYAPDSNYRWMGSIAADINNDILAGYSVSSSSVYPSINVAGRLKGDALGTLESEVSVVAGTGSQTDTRDRWGDYSAMRIDPDGCTFWYTTEYYMLTASFDWSTQIASARFANCQNPAYDGYLEICKQTDPDYPVTGPFSFMVTQPPFFSTGPIVVPVGACSPPTQVPSGILTINEAPQVGVAVENVTAYSYDQYGNYINELDSWVPPQQTATVTVVPGGVSLETVATYTNYAAPQQELKICKIAGSGVKVGTLFYFMTSDGTTHHMDQVEAGPPPGGYCVVDGTWPVNDPVSVTEYNMPPGVSVSNITFNQGPVGQCSPPESYCGVATIGIGLNEVTFTDTGIPLGSCQNSSSLSVLQISGTNVIAYVPKGNWGGQENDTGVAVANIEGTAITPQTIPTTAAVNSCASDSTLLPPQTVCTANTSTVYVIEGTSLYKTLTSAGMQQIGFSGGSCTNCGAAMDSVHHKALIGLSLNSGNPLGSGKPGFQFLDLFNNPTPPAFETAFPSLAKEISEDPLVDPINNFILSASEGGNYEIIDVTHDPTNLSYENAIGDGNGNGNGGAPDSSGEDCTTGIAIAPLEGSSPSLVYMADLKQATFTVGSPGTWADSASQFFTLTESVLSAGACGNAIAQGSHLGIIAGEFGGDEITAIVLPATSGSGTPAMQDWVSCNIGHLFSNGYDPHTVTAYLSPGGNQFPAGDAIAVLANGGASELALVDLTLMLNPTIVPRTSGTGLGHACASGPLPSSVVTFVTLTP